MLALKLLLLSINIGGILSASRPNVCPTWLDYLTIDIYNPKCYYNNDADLDIIGLAAKQGFAFEVHNVTTNDDYILQAFRIKSSGKPIVLAHGIYMNSLDWLLMGANSLPYVLARKGYDVWLVNLRGNMYTSHVNPQISQEAFWDFGLHEMGTLDMPAIVEYVYNKVNRKLILLGFSMSTTVGFIYTSTNPTDSLKYLERYVAMAPVTYVTNIPSLLEGLEVVWDLFKLLCGLTHTYSVLTPYKPVMKFLFSTTLLNMEVWKALVGFTFGLDYAQFNPLTVPVVIAQFGDAIGVKILENYVQIGRRGKFAALDRGTEGNIQHYNSRTAPVYDLSKVQVNVTLVRGLNDAIASTNNVERTYRELTNTPGKCMFDIGYKMFEHFDFISAINGSSMLYEPLANTWLEATC